MKTFIIAALLFSVQYLCAKNIEGWVYDSDNARTPLVGVNVYWAGTTHGTITDGNGYFALDRIQNHRLLVFSYVGYQSDTLLIDQSKPVSIALKQGADLGEIEVVGRVKPTHFSKLNPILTQNITSKELTKFACCNLSESFETNASVDVSYADAISGIKQIKMLGLSGRYSQLMLENIPIIRGSETAFGLEYIPGTWINSIQVSKGTSAVKNGYEGITGQINVIFQNPDGDEKSHFYLYGNQDGKIESNAGLSFKVNEKWGSNLLIATGGNSRKLDMNKDAFLDKPVSYSGHLMNRWNYTSDKVEAKLGISALTESRKGGQVAYDHNQTQDEQTAYGIGVDVNRLNAFSKIGFLLNRPNTSIGWITSANYFDRASFYGHNTLNTQQYNLYTNLIFQSYIGNTQHTYNTGISWVYDDLSEELNHKDEGYVESVPGFFFEYNYIPTERFALLIGVRNDYSTLHGNFITPRVHVKYNLPAITTIRASVGKGYRTPSSVSENTQFLATSRRWMIQDQSIQEEAWNYGLSFTNEIPVNNRELTLSAEIFRTDFRNQLVVDLEQNTNEIYFYNLEGKSYANSIQVEAFYELFKRFELTGGMRWNDVKTDYQSGLKNVPFISRYKALLSAQYRTNLDKWQFDGTVQFHGPQRLLASAASNAPGDHYSDRYVTVIGQITKNYRNWSFYVGGENLTNFIQKNPVIGVDNPFGNDFDASQIWGPVYGRMFYFGIKHKLQK